MSFKFDQYKCSFSISTYEQLSDRPVGPCGDLINGALHRSGDSLPLPGQLMTTKLCGSCWSFVLPFLVFIMLFCICETIVLPWVVCVRANACYVVFIFTKDLIYM